MNKVIIALINLGRRNFHGTFMSNLYPIICELDFSLLGAREVTKSSLCYLLGCRSRTVAFNSTVHRAISALLTMQYSSDAGLEYGVFFGGGGGRS